MSQNTWKLPLPLLTILAGMFVFAFFFLPGGVAEAVCSDPTAEAAFYFPMEALNEGNVIAGGEDPDPLYEGDLTVDATPLSNVAGNTNRILFDNTVNESQIRFTYIDTRLHGWPGDLSNVTYEFWFEVDNPTPRQQLFEVGSSVRGLGIYVDGGSIYAGMWEDADASSSIDATESAFAQVAGVQADVAYHVIAAMDGTSMTLAVDSDAGELGRDTATTATMDGSIAAMGQHAAIGNSQVGNATLNHTLLPVTDGTSGLNGSIDEFAIYDWTSFTTSDIDTRFSDGACEPTAVTMYGIAASVASSLPYIALAVFVLGAATFVVLRRERVLS